MKQILISVAIIFTLGTTAKGLAGENKPSSENTPANISITYCAGVYNAPLTITHKSLPQPVNNLAAGKLADEPASPSKSNSGDIYKFRPVITVLVSQDKVSK